MDHHEATRKLEHLLESHAQHAHELAIELEALVPHLPSGNARELAQTQIKASHKEAKEYRELTEQAKEK